MIFSTQNTDFGHKVLESVLAVTVAKVIVYKYIYEKLDFYLNRYLLKDFFGFKDLYLNNFSLNRRKHPCLMLGLNDTSIFNA